MLFKELIDLICHINKVIPMEDYHLEIQMDNGSSVILDLKSRLETMRFGMLSDSELFKRVTTDGTYIRWNNKVEISVSEVFQLAQKGPQGRKEVTK